MKTCFLWDPGEDNIVKEQNSVGTTVAEYTTEPHHFGNVIIQNWGGVEGQYHFDALGTTLAVTDADQQISDTRQYSAFGETTESTGSTACPFQYVGRNGYYREPWAEQYTVRRRLYASA